MNFWSPYPFVRITLMFVLGILTAQSLSIDIHPVTALAVLAVVIICYVCMALLAKNSHQVTGITGMVLVASLGFFYTSLVNERSVLPPQAGSYDGFAGSITSYPEDKGKYERVVFELEYLFSMDSLIPSSEKVLLYLEKDSTRAHQYGDFLAIYKPPLVIKPSTNPGEFDFSKYWSRKGIHYQAFVASSEYELFSTNSGNHFLAVSYRIRNYCQAIITEYIKDQNQRSIALALILGVKDGLDNEIKEAYAASGAMHVLAVSGLHVGILYLFILYLFRPIRDRKYGSIIIGALSIIILWLYALVTGFSPSVQRAVVMFSIFIVGRMMGRSRNIYNSLAVSAFILLVIDPLMIYEVGFQLSYLAVFGIVFLQPKIYQLWSPNNLLINKAWELSCVSIAAQLATFPLGLYYFHQFPTLFLVSNLVVIPASFLILILGISLLLTSAIGLPLLNLISSALAFVLWLMNEMVFAIESFDFSLISGVSFTLIQTILIYAAIIWIVALFIKRRFSHLTVGFGFFLIVSVIEVAESVDRSSKKEIVFYDDKTTLIDLRRGFDSRLYAGEGFSQNTLKYIVQPHRMRSDLTSEDIEVMSFSNWRSPFEGIGIKEWEGLVLLRIDDPTWLEYEFAHILEVDVLIASNNAIRQLSDLLTFINPKMIVIDGTNNFYVTNLLVKQANKYGIAHHATKLKGAFILEL